MSVCTTTADCRKSQEELASNYALQVALQTMKERCQQLQARLSIVEEENLQLKIEKQRQIRQESKVNIINICDIDKLQEQIAQLSRQKSQLTHHIYMVATENKHLWTKLSILTEANESLGTRLNKISSALSSHTNRSEQLLQDVNHDLGNQSLEEISLKLINNIQQEKSELEQQYAEMVELQSFKDCDFTLTGSDNFESKETCAITEITGDDDSYDMSDDLQSFKTQLVSLLTSLRSQNEMFRKSVHQLKVYSKGEEDCLVCQRHLRGSEKTFCDAGIMTLPNEVVEKDSIDAEVQNINEKLKLQCCPVCFTFSAPTKEELAEHVIIHFPRGEIKDDERFETFCSGQPPSVF